MTATSGGATTFGQWWRASEEVVDVSMAGIREVAGVALRARGATEEGAAFLVASMMAKAAQGDPVRGFGLLRNVLAGAESGAAVLDPPIEVRNDAESTALVDGGPDANGNIVTRGAMQLAIEKAEASGVSWVSCTAFSITLGPLLTMATDRGLVAIVFNSSPPTVAPFGGTTASFGNAPTGIGIPAGDRDPVIVDMSLTNSSSTPIALAALVPGMTVPDGFILDEWGQPTNDPTQYLHDADVTLGAPYQLRGSLLPLGGELAGHKGYALVFALGALAAALSGTDGPWTLRDGHPARLGSQFLVLDPARFVPTEQFADTIGAFIERARAVPTRQDGHGVVYPGERSQQLQREREECGVVAIPKSHLTYLSELAVDHRIDAAVLAPPHLD